MEKEKNKFYKISVSRWNDGKKKKKAGSYGQFFSLSVPYPEWGIRHSGKNRAFVLKKSGTPSFTEFL